LPAGRLSEDIDLIAATDRRSVAHAITRTIERALRVRTGASTGPWCLPTSATLNRRAW
jgi:hypothetical protein